MSHALFDRHRLLATTDVDSARHEVAARFCPHRLELNRPGGRLDMVHNGRGLGSDINLNYLRYGDEVRIVPGRFDKFFLIQIPLAGEAWVQVGDRSVRSDRRRGTIGSPTEPVDMVWSADCEQLLLYVRRAAVESVAGGADDPVVFEPMLDLDAPAVRDWMQLVRLVVDAIESRSSLLDSPLAVGNLEQTIIAALLAGQPNSTRAQPAPATMSSRTLRRAMDAVRDEPQHPWKVAELATRVGVSTRTLQDAFSRELGMTPLQHVRQVRLERARRDLVNAAADAEGDVANNVTDIAFRWGFFHLSRFAQTYRQAFGELPSQTLAG